MKTIFIVALLLVSSVALADGFRCQGGDFRVKMYNEVQPGRGTRNPAVLVVSERGVGTIAVLDAANIVKRFGRNAVSYEGQSNKKQDGRFVFIKLDVEKKPETDGLYTGYHMGRLTVNADYTSRVETLACDRYLKHDRQ